MKFFSLAIVALLFAYVIFTAVFTGSFTSFWSNDNEVAVRTLPSGLSNIPDILLNSAAYQQASLQAAATPPARGTASPNEAIVNIFCTFTNPNYVRTTTGTGFFISEDGVILTNAHVAQFLLLSTADQTGNTDCVIRSGNPATPQYRAELLYIPPTWIQENAVEMQKAVPVGTGERDYALLYVASRFDGLALPASFPALPFNDELLPLSVRNDTVVAAGYPANDFLTTGSQALLTPQQATTSISELYTFGSNYADVFSIRGSAVGAHGASGGPVVNSNGAVIGMIATRGDDSIDGAGSLRAITLSHINRTMQEETGFSLTEQLGGDVPLRAAVFNETVAPFLLAVLQAAG